MFNYNLDKKEIYLYGVIGDPDWEMIGAQQVVDALGQMEGSRVTVRLNTPGGSIDEGIPIYNAMKRHPGGVKTIVDGIAASMGSYIMLAGVERTVAKNAMVMLHNPASIAWGNASEFRKIADVLDKYRERMLPDYAEATGKAQEELIELLDAETWYVGQEILDNGFAQRMEDDEAEEPVLRGIKSIAAKSIAAGTAPTSLFEKKAKAISRSIDERPRLTAAKVAILQMQANDG